MKDRNNIYDNESISSLKGADRVRLRPSVIFGSDAIEGCEHSVFEILSNSIDEAREGFGKEIEVKKYSDGSISVKDYGRGIPVDYNPIEKRYNWELIFCELYAGGKYDNNNSQHYEYSLGLNGLGSCATQYASEYMYVEINRDGFLYKLNFESGENVAGLSKEESKVKQTYTYIKWKPDIKVFKDINVSNEYFRETLKRQAVVNKAVIFKFYDEKTGIEEDFIYENGISDYLEEINNSKEFTEAVYYETEAKGRDSADREEYKFKMELAFSFNNEVNLLEYYHNSSYLEYGGSPDRAVKIAFVYAIDNYLKENNLYNKSEKRLSFIDVEESLTLVLSSFSTMASFENQTKKAVNNKFIQETISDFLKEKLEIYFVENKLEADKIAEQVLVNKRSREKAERTRINIRKKLSGNMDISNRVEKFVNCRTKDVKKREIYIVEGDSALGSTKLGRDAEFQAIIPVRGKILNCLKSDYDRIFASDIITDLIRVLGCGVEFESKNKHKNDLVEFNIDDLRWAKIIICTDADVDGFQIRTLILTMLYRLVPSLITAKKVYIAESPLYEINTSRKTYFAYSEQEKIEIISKIKSKYTIQRSKGLGENQPDMMWETTMNPASRRLILVTPEDAMSTQEYFNCLLGDDLSGRKNFIEEYGHLYIPMADLK